jgi:5-methylcytosine-specific restriction protein A
MRPPVLKPIGAPTLTARRRLCDERRRTVARGYDYAWRKASVFYLTLHPLCECDEHQGKDPRAAATCVDHILPIATHPHLRLEVSNFRAMAKRCHDQHTARTRGFGRAREAVQR